MYAVVAFDKEHETDFIPWNWIVDEIQLGTVAELISKRTLLQCFWPHLKSNQLSKARRERMAPCSDWCRYEMRLLSIAGLLVQLVLQL